MNLSKVAVVANSMLGMVLIILGSVLILFSLLMIIIIIGDGLGGEIAVLLLLAASVWFIVKGVQIRRRVKRFRQYVSLISEQNMRSIEQIAEVTNQSVDFLIKDLQTMIDKGFFANAVINRATNDIIIGGQTVPVASINSAQTIPPVSSQNFVAQVQEWVIDCEGCGASNRVPGQVGECEYCGSLLQHKK